MPLFFDGNGGNEGGDGRDVVISSGSRGVEDKGLRRVSDQDYFTVYRKLELLEWFTIIIFGPDYILGLLICRGAP